MKRFRIPDYIRIFVIFAAIILLYSCASGGMATMSESSKSDESMPATAPQAEPAPAPETGSSDAPAVSKQSGPKPSQPAEGFADGIEDALGGGGMAMASEYAKEEKPAEPSTMTEADAKTAAEEETSEITGESTARTTAHEPQPEPVFLSADDSNSAASPVIIRKLIRSGKYVHPVLVRTYEFLNYYSFDYEPPAEGIAVIPQMRKKPDTDNIYSLQVAVRSGNRNFEDALPMQFTILLDISGSMAGESMELAKDFLYQLNSRLRGSDRISLVTFSRDADLIFDNLPAGSEVKRQLDALFRGIKASDVTNLESGIMLGYTIAEQNYSFNMMNRVIVMSDGGANAGSTSKDIIGEYAKDSDRQGIYLAGISMGEGFNDGMMDTLTDQGRGAYLFLDEADEINRILDGDAFLSNFDLAVKDVRLKMQMPAGWEMEQFHGEQISTTASEVTPQYLAPGDQMIYHMELKLLKDSTDIENDLFEFEAEYTPIGSGVAKKSVTATVAEMTGGTAEIEKGDAVVAFAEMIKTILLPLGENVEVNLEALDSAYDRVESAQFELQDPELDQILSLIETYRLTLQFGEQLGTTPDRNSDAPAAAQGMSPNQLLDVEIYGPRTDTAIRVLSRLLRSTRLTPQEGYKFLALSSGPVGNSQPAGSGQLSDMTFPDPEPRFIGNTRIRSGGRMQVYDLHQIKFTLKAPVNAKSFSFDFNFFSAEYPEYVNQNFNDSFYAIIEAGSTNQNTTTNITFDSNNNTIEVDNNYFQNPFHPIPNTGTGFDYHGSTGWLRTSWPIRGGEEFTLTFSIHDEGDGIYDSLVVLDNFIFHDFDAVGTTDPLN